METPNDRAGILPDGCKDLIDVLKLQQSGQAWPSALNCVPKFRLNGHITSDRVRVVDLLGKSGSVLPLAKAVKLAHSQGLDIIEIDPSASPPVCLMVDYGWFRWLAGAITNQVLQQMKGPA